MVREITVLTACSTSGSYREEDLMKGLFSSSVVRLVLGLVVILSDP